MIEHLRDYVDGWRSTECLSESLRIPVLPCWLLWSLMRPVSWIPTALRTTYLSRNPSSLFPTSGMPFPSTALRETCSLHWLILPPISLSLLPPSMLVTTIWVATVSPCGWMCCSGLPTGTSREPSWQESGCWRTNVVIRGFHLMSLWITSSARSCTVYSLFLTTHGELLMASITATQVRLWELLIKIAYCFDSFCYVTWRCVIWKYQLQVPVPMMRFFVPQHALRWARRLRTVPWSMPSTSL